MKKPKIKISFDWDDCLDNTETIKAFFAVMLVLTLENDIELIILTSKDILGVDILEQLQSVYGKNNWFVRIITPKSFDENYRNNFDKLFIIKNERITLHFDDDAFEVQRINAVLPGRAVLVNYSGNANF